MHIVAYICHVKVSNYILGMCFVPMVGGYLKK
jgi:hypothetical protein